MKLTTTPAVKVIKDPNVRDYYVCGDIHGMLNPLLAKLRQLGFDPELDRLVCCGDLGDRGWNSYEVAMLLKEDWFESVLGNHEEMALKALMDSRFKAHHLDNGGRWLHELNQEQKKLVASLYENLPYAIEIQHNGFTYGVVHADVLGSNWESFKSNLLGNKTLLSFLQSSFLYSSCVSRDVYTHCIWSRERFLQPSFELREIKGVDAVFFGHNITPRPIRKLNMFYIDTGAYLSHKVTILKLDPVTLNNIPPTAFF